MGFKHFYINIILRLVGITGMISLLLFFLFISTDYIISFFSTAFLIFLIINLFTYINKTNRDFTNFLTSFVHDDFTIHYSGRSKGHTFDKLYQTFELIQAKFRVLNFEKELVNQHLQNLVEHIDIGIISVDKDLNIQLTNKAFKKMFNMPYLTQGQNLSILNETLFQTIKSLKPDQKKLVKVKIDNVIQELAVHANVYKLNAREFKLISIKNIHGELDVKEMESYQKLIRVLTHEIMNTLSPIISLSGTINRSIKELAKDQSTMDEATGNYLNEGIEAIHDRSEGLLKFTESYRKLMRLPQPKMQSVETQVYFNKLQKLFDQQMHDNNITCSIEILDNQNYLFIDPDLFEQVLINIYKNAFEAFPIFNSKTKPGTKIASRPTINTKVLKNKSGGTTIKITDNGCGMTTESIENAFTPFYTTKNGGSGIGLSLSKQIILLHKGSIIIDSKLNEGTNVNIFLNQ